MNRKIFPWLLLSLLLLSVSGQQPKQLPQAPSSPVQQMAAGDKDQDTVRITTNLVQVDVVVTKDGKLVSDLRPEDFEILEDGKAQTITTFSYISNVPQTAARSMNTAEAPQQKDKIAPPVVPAVARPHDVRRTVALVVDDLGMSFESMAILRQQMRKFLDERLQPNDLVAIIRTGGEVGALQQFTTDRQLLHSALEHLKFYPCSRVGSLMCGWPTVRDSLRSLRFVLQGMRQLPGRKSMVIFSDDFPVREQEPEPLTRPDQGLSKETDDIDLNESINHAAMFERISELAIRASVVIYAVDTRGLQYTGLTAADGIPLTLRVPDPASDRVPSVNGRLQMENLQRTTSQQRALALRRGREGAAMIATQTGGFLIFNSNDYGFQRVMDDQQGYYLIGYRPTDQTFNRRFHHIKARVKHRGLTARTREGFYGVTEGEARSAELTARDQLDRALISPFSASDITVRLTTFFANDAGSGSLLHSFLFLDPRALTFTDQPDGTHQATFDLGSIMFGYNGKVVSRQNQTISLRLGAKTYDRALRDGVVYGFDMPVKQFGTFQIRVAVRDTISSRIGAAGQFIEVPNLGNDQLALSGIVARDEANLHVPPSSKETEADEITRGPALRRFHQGSILNFAYAVYNAHFDRTNQLPQLSTQTRLFRDGKPIFTGSPKPLDVTGETDLQHITANARLQLGPDLPPGEYVFQIIVEDRLAKEKQRTATQWIDFEVVK